MNLQVFDGIANKQDGEYEAWRNKNPKGFVGNFTRDKGSKYFCLHKAGCYHIAQYTRSTRKDSFTTGQCIKVCSDKIADIDSWANEHRQNAKKKSCRTCNP